MGQRTQIHFSQGVCDEKPEKKHPPFLVLQRKHSSHGNGGNAEVADGIVA